MTLRFCGSCFHELRPKKVGIVVEAFAKIGSYQKYAADILACVNCGNEIIITGDHPIIERHHPEYAGYKANQIVYFEEVTRGRDRG